MRWMPQQHRLFQAAAADPATAQRVGLLQAQARKMDSEGVMARPKLLAAALRKSRGPS